MEKEPTKGDTKVDQEVKRWEYKEKTEIQIHKYAKKNVIKIPLGYGSLAKGRTAGNLRPIGM